MLKNILRSAATGRLVGMFLVTVVLISVAVSVALLSFETSRSHAGAARADRENNVAAMQAVNSFWRERASMNEYLLESGPSLYVEVQMRRARFELLVGRLATDDSAERGDLERALASNRHLFAVFDNSPTLVHAVGTQGVVRQLQTAESRVIESFDDLQRRNQRDYRYREDAASAAARRALEVETGSALLALAALCWFFFTALRLVRTVDRQNERLLDADRVKDDFVSTISHELRTPITAIQGYLELLLDERDSGPLSTEQRSFVTTVQRSSQRLLRLVNDLLLVAQARAGQLEMHPTECDALEIVTVAVEAARGIATKRGIVVSLESAVSRVPIQADAVRLGQAIDNLLSNAIKFTPAGGSIRVALDAGPTDLTLTVSDTGMGMAPAEVERMFERFFRTDSAQAKQIQGTGLGLAITKSIVEAHGGTITVTSEEQVGTTFSISLPVTRAAGLRPRDEGSRRPLAVV